MAVVHNHTFQVRTTGRKTYDITAQVQSQVTQSKITDGQCTIFIQHTSASLIITENADPRVHDDLDAFLSRLVQDGDRLFTHRDEGPDDMASHVRSVLTQTSLTIPVKDARCTLGTWQGIYVWEHRQHPHQRNITVSVIGR